MDLNIQRLSSPPRSEVRQLLLGSASDPHELPPLADLATAAHALASGRRHKVLLPVGVAPLEYALQRRGNKVLVSVYETSSAPEVHQLDRVVCLRALLDTCARAGFERAEQEEERAAAQIARLFAERAARTEIVPQTHRRTTVRRHGGTDEATELPLAFGYQVDIAPSAPVVSRASRADVHAMLFTGSLWAFVNGRRFLLVKGPVLLAAQRMVVAVRALMEAWENGRPTNVRLRTGKFSVGVRLSKTERASLTLRTPAGELRIDDTRPEDIALPVLRLASDMIRSLISVDRSQTRNLRVTALRDEVRSLRRAARQQRTHDGFVNPEAEQLRLEHPSLTEHTLGASAAELPSPSGKMRFESRWQVALDGLDAESTYFCGDRIVLSGPGHCLAVDRQTGDVLWAREGADSTLMAGTTLLRLSSEGELELCSVEDGEPYATTRIAPPVMGPKRGLIMRGHGASPVAVLTEGSARLVAIDLRTGEPRWRFSARREVPPAMCRAGRILLIADDNAIHALDASSGEDLWRFAIRGRFSSPPVVVGDRVVAMADGRKGKVFGIDLFSGEACFELALGEAAAAPPIPVPEGVLIALSSDRLVSVRTATGTLRWDESDPGVAIGAAPLVVDDLLITNAPGGGLAATDLRDGSPRWTQLLGDPIGDEVPRRLEPVLRGGALFVPAGDVFIVRPSDGAILGELDGDLVPDRLRVDERGWVYVAEESGHVAAYAPAATLRLIHGGA